MTTPELAPQLPRSTRFRVFQWVARIALVAFLVWAPFEWPIKDYWAMWLSAVGWFAFTIYWAMVGRGTRPTKSSESGRSRMIHQLLLQGGIFMLFMSIPGLRQQLLPEWWGWAPIGLAVQFLFFRLAQWARRHLGRNWSGRVEVKEEHELIRSGPYRKLRHPIYTAMLGMSLGTAIVSGRTHALIGVAMVAFAYWRKIGIEEATLRTAFGSQYDSYRKETWGMIPGLF